MRPRNRWRIYLKVIESLWDGRTKVAYSAFHDRLIIRQNRLKKNQKDDLATPSQQTYSRVWRDFCHRRRLRRGTRNILQDTLMKGLSVGAWDSKSPDDIATVKAGQFVSQQGFVPPVSAELLRRIRAIRARLRRREQDARNRVLASALGTTLSTLPLARRYRVARNLLRYPPSSQGKVGVAKLEIEDNIRREIDETLIANGLALPVLLSQPDLDDAFEFVDCRANSTLERWEMREVIRAIPLYLASRHQQAVDAILFTFVRLARLLKLRVQTNYDEQTEGENRALFEKRAGEFKGLRRAVLNVLEHGDPSILKPFRPVLQKLEEQGEEAITQHGYYQLLANRGTFARKIARRLRGIHLEGRDANASIVLQALQEVFLFAPFAEEIPRTVRKQLSFLDVSEAHLSNRRVFESIVLITVADLLWLGRITSQQSKRFGNIWDLVATSEKDHDIKSVETKLSVVEKELHRAWDDLQKAAGSSPAVINGKLVSKRPPRKWLLEEELLHKKAKQKFLASIRPISIVDLMAEVNDCAGILDAIRLERVRGRHLLDEQRRRLALAVVLARGMNVGVPQMSTLLGRWYTVGRLTNFDESYLTIKSLRLANGILLNTWERLGLGKFWGSGTSVAADGRSILASERNLQSGYHYRHRKSGVTLYWLVRDDWIGARVGVIGNHDWESWFLLDGLLNPVGGSAPQWAAGDTHGQHLSLWGLSYLTGKSIRARFRRLSGVKLYHDGPVKDLPLRGVLQIRWYLIERSLPSILKLVMAIRRERLAVRDILRIWNIYDEKGVNISEALRELGKAIRSIYVLRFALSEDMRKEVRETCNRAETWNSFQEAVFWGHGGRMRTNNPRRQEVNALCMQLLMNSIVFYNAFKYGQKLRKIKGSCPVTWEHVRLFGDYRITSGRLTIGGDAKK